MVINSGYNYKTGKWKLPKDERPTIECKECKQKFSPKSIRHKWCSKKCHRFGYRKMRVKQGEKSKCLYCKKEYKYATTSANSNTTITSISKRKFCSVLCSTQYFKLEKRLCPKCNKMFKPKRSTAIHCSVKCAKARPVIKCIECGESPTGIHQIRYARRKENVNSYRCRKCKFYDFETHCELARNSGCTDAEEWIECGARGFLPERIRTRPDVASWNYA